MWFNFGAPLTLMLIGGLATLVVMYLTRDAHPPKAGPSGPSFGGFIEEGMDPMASRRTRAGAQSERFLIEAIERAHANASPCRRELGAEDEAIAEIYAAEDALLEIQDPSMRARLAQARIRLRRLAVTASDDRDGHVIETIQRTLADATDLMEAMAVRLREADIALQTGRADKR